MTTENMDLANQVGRFFVQVYYQTLNEKPSAIGRYYLLEKSTVIRTDESGMQAQYSGRDNIVEGIAGKLEPGQTRTEISSISCGELAYGHIVVHLVGFIATSGQDAEKFTQVFVLFKDGEKDSKRYACALDMLTYLHGGADAAPGNGAMMPEAHAVQQAPAPAATAAQPEPVAEQQPEPQEQQQPPAQPAAAAVVTEQPAPEAQQEQEQPQPATEQQEQPQAAAQQAEAAPVVEQPKPRAKPSSWAALVSSRPAAAKPAAAPRVQQQKKQAQAAAAAKAAADQKQTAKDSQQQQQQPQQQQQKKGQQQQKKGQQQAAQKGGAGRGRGRGRGQEGRQGRQGGSRERGTGRGSGEGSRPRRPHRDDKDFNARSLFVKSVPLDATEQDVCDVFASVGEVKSVDLFRTRNNTSNFKCAVVEFPEPALADACLAEDKRNTFVINETTLGLDKRRERPPRGGRGRGGPPTAAAAAEGGRR